ncbi:hypothetical protein CHX27_04555 [Flavobacterium aurantiibacter]|uniref:Uncharacterized protein n=1 Tax=Flavobacterium aurantiibacter TaxID=2023067 RepID=A0A255ZY09_9FLAO|nr:hypothetical protein CHX27_04555 [Flavobacterium aurantiibacter]
MKNLQKFEIAALSIICVAAFLSNKVVGLTAIHVVLSSLLSLYFFPIALFIKQYKPLNARSVFSLLILSYSISHTVFARYSATNYQDYVSLSLLLLNVYFTYHFSHQQDYRKYLHFLAIILSGLASSFVS